MDSLLLVNLTNPDLATTTIESDGVEYATKAADEWTLQEYAGNYDDEEMTLQTLEGIARNCSLRLEHIEALNISNSSLLMRLYNMCEHTWDPNKTWDIYYWEELLPPLVIYSLTLLLGVVGNLLIIVGILCYRKMKTPTNIFLASLAFADLLLCFICIPVKLAELFSFTWTFGFFLCKLVNYMQNVSAIASVLNLTVMSLERCYAIVYPMKAKSVCTVSKANKVVCLVWLLSFLLAVPTLIVQIHMEVGLVQKAFWCVRDETWPFGWRAHELYFLLVLLIIPGSLMTAAYGAIAREICRCMKERAYLVANNSCSNSRANEVEMQQMSLVNGRPSSMKSVRSQSSIRSATSKGTHQTLPPKKAGCNNAAAAGVASARYDIDFSCLEEEDEITMESPATGFTMSVSFNTSPQQLKSLLATSSERFKKRTSETGPISAMETSLLASGANGEEASQSKKQEAVASRKNHALLKHPSNDGGSSGNGDALAEAWIPINSGYKVQKQSLRKFRRVIRMLVVIIVTFVACWTPYLIFNVLQSFGLLDTQLRGMLKYMKTSFTLTAYLNSALNPIIYGFMCRSFRENFLMSVCSCWRRQKGNDRRAAMLKQPHSRQVNAKAGPGHQEPRGGSGHEEVNGLRVNRSRGPSLSQNGGNKSSPLPVACNNRSLNSASDEDKSSSSYHSTRSHLM